MTEHTDGPGLISESDDRYDLVGLDVVNRETGEADSHRPLSRGEIDMPGFVEHIERSYHGTTWQAVRVWRTNDQPSGTRAENPGT